MASVNRCLDLGELRNQLRGFPLDASIRFDVGGFPSEPHSYRGFYEMLAFQPSDELVTVSEFLNVLDGIEGTEFIAWKGGDYFYDAETCVWFAHRGNSDGRLIVGVEVKAGMVTILTDSDDYFE